MNVDQVRDRTAAAIADALDTTAVELVASITDQETPCRSTA